MDELRRAVLVQLGELRGPKDPLGELARAVLAGQLTLQQAASSTAYAEALLAAARQTQVSLSAMAGEERAELARAADLLRGAR